MDLSEVLGVLALEEYWHGQIPGEHDAYLSGLIDEVQTTGQFAEVTRGLDHAKVWVLHAFAWRAASYAVRVREVAWLRSGLVAALLAVTADDWRDVMETLCLLNHSFELLEADPVEEFRAAAALAGEMVVAGYEGVSVRSYAMNFVMRDARGKALSAFFYAEGSDENGFLYIRTR